jgi:hypothetical protein
MNGKRADRPNGLLYCTRCRRGRVDMNGLSTPTEGGWKYLHQVLLFVGYVWHGYRHVYVIR